MKKGGIYTGYVESVDFPNKGNVVVRTEEDGQVIEEKAVDLFVDNAAVFASKGEMRKLVQGGGVSLNKEKLAAFDQVVTTADLLDEKYLLVQRGKKNYYLLIAK